VDGDGPPREADRKREQAEMRMAAVWVVGGSVRGEATMALEPPRQQGTGDDSALR
jgi:hypothetical protein